MELLLFLQEHRTPGWDALFLTATRLGEETVVLAVLLLLYWCLDKRAGLRVGLCYFAGGWMGQLLKLVFLVPRPFLLNEALTPHEAAVGSATGYSFPSGHTSGAVSMAMGLGLSYKKALLWVLMALYVALVGLSRLYLGVHTPLDVGVAVQYVMEDLAKIPVRVELASEFRYRKPLLDPKSLVIIVSQSGETADSLAALREAKARGVKTLAIVNVVGSSIAREADAVFYTLAGPEIAVATTKAYSTQLIAGYVLALEFGRVRGELAQDAYEALIQEMQTLPEKVKKLLEDKERIQWFAAKFSNAKDIFFLGRGTDYAVSLEGSLKMKEISYIHSEAYAAGELKHGTISLIENGTLVVCVLTQPELYEKMISNMVEVKSRGAYLMGLTSYGNYSIEDTADFTVYIPRTDPHFAPSLAVVPLQLMGYYVSLAKGLDVDKPRNLAKSVTVE